MEGTYEVTLGGQKMGSVTLKKQGLYWLFDCRCQVSGEVMYDLVVNTADDPIKLGLLIPAGSSFCLKTKLPAKRLGQGSPIFSLQPRHLQMQGYFVTVKPEEPFAYLRQLESAYLARQNGEIGLLLRDTPIR